MVKITIITIGMLIITIGLKVILEIMFGEIMLVEISMLTGEIIIIIGEHKDRGKDRGKDGGKHLLVVWEVS